MTITSETGTRTNVNRAVSGIRRNGSINQRPFCNNSGRSRRKGIARRRKSTAGVPSPISLTISAPAFAFMFCLLHAFTTVKRFVWRPNRVLDRTILSKSVTGCQWQNFSLTHHDTAAAQQTLCRSIMQIYPTPISASVFVVFVAQAYRFLVFCIRHNLSPAPCGITAEFSGAERPLQRMLFRSTSPAPAYCPHSP